MKVIVEAEVDLEEVPTRILRQELNGRDRIIHDEARADIRLANDLRTAFYARNASRFEALLTVLDPQTKPTQGLYKKEPTP